MLIWEALQKAEKNTIQCKNPIMWTLPVFHSVPPTSSSLCSGHTSHCPPACYGLASLAVFGSHNTPPKLHLLRPPMDPKCQMPWPWLGLILLNSEIWCTEGIWWSLLHTFPWPQCLQPLPAPSYLLVKVFSASTWCSPQPSSSLSLRLSAPLGGHSPSLWGQLPSVCSWLTNSTFRLVLPWILDPITYQILVVSRM